ncbi:hypothetical protein EGW08_015322 [Elysia chlorotica]|uniref:Uncharacterized protein n=1 Tax=Elysia chlorotica TaxID=188477 RepID=A0A3S0ZWD7_ELYCH|nr:hypothetical protein EGW08_015322 [Elysia chlorotica]
MLQGVSFTLASPPEVPAGAQKVYFRQRVTTYVVRECVSEWKICVSEWKVRGLTYSTPASRGLTATPSPTSWRDRLAQRGASPGVDALPTEPPGLTAVRQVEEEGLVTCGQKARVPVPVGLVQDAESATDLDRGEKADTEMVLSWVTERDVTLWLAERGCREGESSLGPAGGPHLNGPDCDTIPGGSGVETLVLMRGGCGYAESLGVGELDLSSEVL